MNNKILSDEIELQKEYEFLGSGTFKGDLSKATMIALQIQEGGKELLRLTPEGKEYIDKHNYRYIDLHTGEWLKALTINDKEGE